MRPSSSLLVAYTSMFLGELEKKGKVIGIYGPTNHPTEGLWELFSMHGPS